VLSVRFESEGAAKALDEAEALLRSVGNSEGLIAVHLRRGFVEEKRGNELEATRHYREAARHADLMGNRRARTLAMESLSSLGK
jgi:hypothetical protein